MKKNNELAEIIYHTKKETLAIIPDRVMAERFIDNLMGLLFGQGCAADEAYIMKCISGVKDELKTILKVCCGAAEDDAGTLAEHFFESLLPVYRLLLEDAAFIEASDPAARSRDEVIITYPGFYAIAVHRFAHVLNRLKIPYLPRLIAEHAHSKTSIDIHPGATIGSPFAIDHGTGVVIGETAEIGKHVIIYQGVTLGALIVNKSGSNIKRHPTIEDNVALYAGCTILGGNTTVGHHSVIGGNVWLTSSVAPYSVVYNTSQIKIRKFDEPVDYTI
ncbi:MAG: serine O-acetyltransferase [Bacteroidetes bacterium]|nr:serine O-acetyltransferase [Bacteroidota bacterium]